MKIKVALLLLLTPLLLNAMDSEDRKKEDERKAPRPPAAAEPTYKQIAKMAISSPLVFYTEQKNDLDIALTVGEMLLHYTPLPTNYNGMILIPEFLGNPAHESGIRKQLVVPFNQMLIHSNDILKQLKVLASLVDSVESPESIALKNAAYHLPLLEKCFKCRTVDAIVAWPTIFKIFLTAEYWQTFRRLSDCSQADICDYLEKRKEAMKDLPDDEKRAEERHTTWLCNRWQLIQSIKEGKIKEAFDQRKNNDEEWPEISHINDRCYQLIRRGEPFRSDPRLATTRAILAQKKGEKST